jgi:hypothetical protein
MNTDTLRAADRASAARPRRFEPMLLLVVGIPSLTVLGGIFTLYLAFNGPHELAQRNGANVAPEPNFKGVPLR